MSHHHLLIGILLLTGCHRAGMRMPGPLDALGQTPGVYDITAAPEEAPLALPPRAPAPTGGAAIAAGAARLLDQKPLVVNGEVYRYDCSGMVAAAYAAGGLALSGSSRSLYALAQERGVLHTELRPAPGDVVFFDNSYDRNRNGRRDDPLTHVGVVESVDAAGTVTVVHLGSKGVVRMKMNLERPDDSSVNSQLRASSDRDGGPTLSGQLWRGSARFWALPES